MQKKLISVIYLKNGNAVIGIILRMEMQSAGSRRPSSLAMEMQLLWRNTTAITGRTRC